MKYNIDVPCPTCGAAPRVPCTINGEQGMQCHPARNAAKTSHDSDNCIQCANPAVFCMACVGDMLDRATSGKPYPTTYEAHGVTIAAPVDPAPPATLICSLTGFPCNCIPKEPGHWCCWSRTGTVRPADDQTGSGCGCVCSACLLLGSLLLGSKPHTLCVLQCKLKRREAYTPCGNNKVPTEDPSISASCTEPEGHGGLHFDKHTGYEWNATGFQTRTSWLRSAPGASAAWPAIGDPVHMTNSINVQWHGRTGVVRELKGNEARVLWDFWGTSDWVEVAQLRKPPPPPFDRDDEKVHITKGELRRLRAIEATSHEDRQNLVDQLSNTGEALRRASEMTDEARELLTQYRKDLLGRATIGLSVDLPESLRTASLAARIGKLLRSTTPTVADEPSREVTDDEIDADPLLRRASAPTDGTHAAHCSPIACKYGDKACPIVRGTGECPLDHRISTEPCEDCHNDVERRSSNASPVGWCQGDGGCETAATSCCNCHRLVRRQEPCTGSASSGNESLRIGDEVDLDNGPLLGGGTRRVFVTNLNLQGHAHVQVGWAKPDTSVGGAPAYAMKATGRRWNDDEKTAIVAYLTQREVEGQELAFDEAMARGERERAAAGNASRPDAFASEPRPSNASPDKSIFDLVEQSQKASLSRGEVPKGWEYVLAALTEAGWVVQPRTGSVPSWYDYEIDTDDVGTLEGFDGVVVATGDIAAQTGIRMSRTTARTLGERLMAITNDPVSSNVSLVEPNDCNRCGNPVAMHREQNGYYPCPPLRQYPKETPKASAVRKVYRRCPACGGYCDCLESVIEAPPAADPSSRPTPGGSDGK